MSRAQRVLASISVAGLALMFAVNAAYFLPVSVRRRLLGSAEHARAILIAVQNLNRGLMTG